MAYTYSVCRSKTHAENGEIFTTYGIIATDSSGKNIARFEDISLELCDIKRLIALLDGEELEAEQLTYIIEDFVESIF